MILGKIWRYYRERGVRALLRRLRSAIHRRSTYVLLYRDLDEAPDHHHPEVRFRIGTIEDASWVAGHWPPNFDYVGRDVEGVIRKRIACGEILLLGTADGDDRDLIWMGWITKRDYALLALFEGDVPDTDGCAKNDLTKVKYRGRGIGRCGARFREAVAFEQGLRRLWFFILEDNAVSREMFLKLGCQPFGEFSFMQRLGRRYAELRREDGSVRRYPLRGISGQVA
jgi:hypothetical protein